MNLRITMGIAALLALPLGATAQDSAGTESATSARAARNTMDIGELITRFARKNGKQLIMDPRVHGDIPVAGMDPDRVGYEKLLSILTVNQLAAVSRGDVLIVVPDANSRQLTTPVYTERNFKALDDEIVTLLVKGKNACVAMLVPVLRPLMPQSAHLAAEVQTNSLIINDHAGNVRRIAELFDALDRSAAPGRACDTESFYPKKTN